MKKEVVISAKTVDEARELAAKELGAPSVDSIEYTVLEESKKGFLGIGAAPAKISATYTVGGEQDALTLIKELLVNMGLEAEVTMTDGESGEKKITVEGTNAAILIGHHGETLDALQHIATLAANKRVNGEKQDYVKISVDVEGYRAKREETLRSLARRMADRVLKYKKSVMLEPMNPYDRRIIHSEVQNIEGVSTNSIGSDGNRKVVIYLDAKGAAKKD